MQLCALLENDIIPEYIIFHQHYFKRLILQFLNRFIWKNEYSNKLIKFYKIKTYNIRSINSRNAIQLLKKMNHSIIVTNSGYIKKSTIDSLSNIIFINIHASKLPNYRGVSNVEWALWHKEDIYMTVHKISPGIDEGDILYQERINISSMSSVSEIKKNVMTQIPAITAKAIKKYLNNEISFSKQEFIGDPLKQYYSIHPVLLEILENRIKSGN